MDYSHLKERLEIAKKVATKAGDSIIRNNDKKRIVDTKSNESDFVTQFDVNVQRAIIENIKRSFPGDHFIAEEEGMDSKTVKGNVWIIDPIDGTLNFVHRLPLFCVSLAFFEDKEPLIGVVYWPSAQLLIYAAKNNGAFLNDNKITVSSKKNLSDSLVTLGTSNRTAMDLMSVLHDKVQRIRMLGTAALQAAFVGAGFSEAYISVEMKIWDIAASYLIVKEAGGIITNWNGKEIDVFDTKKMIFSNSFIYHEVSKLIKDVDIKPGY
ncbi:MAG: inositol monophosphatase [Kosmotoga sp.]|nr:MAG: inositol monophosphatase [Kosmotoga sp.]